MQKRIVFISILLLLYSSRGVAQTIKNFGDAQIHNNAELGVFSSFINDGILSGESGLMGFYGSNSLELSGSQIPSVFDVEIANENGLYLDIPIEVNNNMNFVFGNIITDRDQPFNYLDLNTNATYQGESDFSKVDGFIEGTTVGESYLFPTGDETFLRPLAVNAAPLNTVLKCAYFFENPNISISNSFNSDITEISQHEFWKLYGENPLKITIGWDLRSSISELTSKLSNLTIVGFHKENNQWVDLGASQTTGTLVEGFITSILLNPNEYEGFTFASVRKENVLPDKYNYFVSPNGDGANDFLIIPELEAYENNKLQIFNRYGRMVFEAENYSNEFSGIDNSNKVIKDRSEGLPEGVYYYIVSLDNEKNSLQGFLYLTR